MQKIASCGNDCFVCPRYIATQSDDVIRLKAVAELWYRLGWRDTVVSPEEIMCCGCSSSNFCRYGIQRCAFEKKIDNCGNCKDYPCELTIRSFEQTQKYSDIIKGKCMEEEYQCFKIAFFSKKENLDGVKMNDWGFNMRDNILVRIFQDLVNGNGFASIPLEMPTAHNRGFATSDRI